MAKITIIDDDTEILENTSSILRGEGHEVNTLDTTDNALDVLIENRPDILILDVMFPENPTEGFNFARQVRQRREIENLPIILMTGVNQEFPMDFSAKDIHPEWMPVQDFVEKPVSVSTLLERVKTMLEASR